MPRLFYLTGRKAWGEHLHSYYSAKHDEECGKNSKCDAKLADCGCQDVKNPCPICGKASSKTGSDDESKAFKCVNGHEWKKPK